MISLGGGGGFDLFSDLFDGAAKNDESFACPGLVTTFCFFVGFVAVKDEDR